MSNFQSRFPHWLFGSGIGTLGGLVNKSIAYLVDFAHDASAEGNRLRWRGRALRRDCEKGDCRKVGARPMCGSSTDDRIDFEGCDVVSGRPVGKSHKAVPYHLGCHNGVHTKSSIDCQIIT
jgi:hypothetical protein